MCSKDKATTKDVVGERDRQLPYNLGEHCTVTLCLTSATQSPAHTNMKMTNIMVGFSMPGQISTSPCWRRAANCSQARLTLCPEHNTTQQLACYNAWLGHLPDYRRIVSRWNTIRQRAAPYGRGLAYVSQQQQTDKTERAPHLTFWASLLARWEGVMAGVWASENVASHQIILAYNRQPSPG